MSDIIVTVPKDQIPHFHNDKVPSIDAWWYVHRLPKRLYRGDWIGFVFEDAIRYAASVTDQVYVDGGPCEIHFEDCGYIKPIPHEHFRSYRYFDFSEQKGAGDHE